MTRIILRVVSVTMLLLMWLALDDITTGTEPSQTLEWTMVVAGVLWLLELATKKNWRRPGETK